MVASTKWNECSEVRDMLEDEEEGEVVADDDDNDNVVLLQLPPSLFARLLTLCMMMHYNLVKIP